MAVLAIIAGLGALITVSVYFMPESAGEWMIWVVAPLLMAQPLLALAGPTLGILAIQRARPSGVEAKRLATVGLIIGILGLATVLAMFVAGLYGMSVNG